MKTLSRSVQKEMAAWEDKHLLRNQSKVKQTSFQTTFLGTTYDCHYIKEPEQAAKALQFLMQKDCLFAIDTETAALPKYKHIKEAGLSPHLSSIRLIQVFDGTNVLVFDLRWFPERKLKMFVPFLSTKRFVAHYAIFDLQRFIQLGIQDMNLHCTHILAKLVFHSAYATDFMDASLEGLCKSLFDIELPKPAQKSDWSEPELTFEQIEYAAHDAIAVYFCADKLVSGLDKFGLHRIYQLEKDVQHPIAQMQLNGFRLDPEGHRELIPQWTEELLGAKKLVQEITGIKRLTGPKLGEWFESSLDTSALAMWPRTETGKLSMSADTLDAFSWHNAVKPFALYQKKATLCSTFGQNLIEQINPATNCLHPHFKQSGARTGRLSCSKPNLQNLPRDKAIRSNFIADEGHTLLCLDYSQIELRIAAEVSGDKKMQKAYREGIDLHALTASGVLGIPINSVTESQRQLGKALGLGLLFGLGAAKYCHYSKKNLGVDIRIEESRALIEGYRETYSGLRAWQVAQAERCEATMMAQTPFGKKRKLDDKTYYGGGLNMPIQGAAAEVIKCSLVRLEKSFRGIGKLVNCVHDENLIQVPDDDNKYRHLKEMERCMVLAYKDVFPNGITKGLTEGNFGRTWTQAKSKPTQETIRLLQAA